MYKRKKILVVIPARGGSKGIPRKNIKPLSGKPLISYVIGTAKKVKIVDKVIVSSEDEEILHISKLYGADILKRDIRLSDDKTTLDDVIFDITKELEAEYDLIITIQPTSPLLKKETLENAIKKIIDEEKNSVMSLTDATHLYWKEENGKIISNYKKRVNRQYLDKQYQETGAVIGARTKFILKNKTRIDPNSICFVIQDCKESVDVDSYLDWRNIEAILSERRIAFNVIGTQKSGLGHVYRTLVLSLYLNQKPTFFVHKKESLAIKKIQENFYPLEIYTNHKDFLHKLKKNRIEILINDILDTEELLVKNIQKQGIKVVNFEDLGEGHKFADLVFNALFEFSENLNKVFYGYKYECLRLDVLLSSKKEIQKKVEKILITCGGTDEKNLTQLYLDSLQKINYQGEILLILGLGYKHQSNLKKFISKSKLKIKSETNIKAIAPYILNADLVLTSNGRTTYEIACIGTPALSVSQNMRESYHTFGQFTGTVKNLGLVDMVSPDKISQEIENLINNYKKRKEINQKMLSLKLEEGINNILSKILSL